LGLQVGRLTFDRTIPEKGVNAFSHEKKAPTA
jgi:hypothetical protein